MQLGEGIAREPEIDEAGAGDLGPRHQRLGRLELANHLLRDGARILPLPPGEREREVGRQVAVGLVPRALENELDVVPVEHPCDARELGAEQVVHSDLPFLAGLSDLAGLAASALGAGSDLEELLDSVDEGSFRAPFPSLP